MSIYIKNPAFREMVAGLLVDFFNSEMDKTPNAFDLDLSDPEQKRTFIELFGDFVEDMENDDFKIRGEVTGKR